MIAAGILLSGFFTSADSTSFSQTIDSTLAQLFGTGRIVLPFFLGGVGIWLLIARFGSAIDVEYLRIAGVLLLFVAFASTLQWYELLFDVFPSYDALEAASQLKWEAGEAGGLLGHTVYIFLARQLGDTGVVVILFFWWLVALMLAAQVTTGDIAARIRNTRHAMQTRRAAREARREAKKLEKAAAAAPVVAAAQATAPPATTSPSPAEQQTQPMQRTTPLLPQAAAPTTAPAITPAAAPAAEAPPAEKRAPRLGGFFGRKTSPEQDRATDALEKAASKEESPTRAPTSQAAEVKTADSPAGRRRLFGGRVTAEPAKEEVTVHRPISEDTETTTETPKRRLPFSLKGRRAAATEPKDEETPNAAPSEEKRGRFSSFVLRRKPPESDQTSTPDGAESRGFIGRRANRDATSDSQADKSSEAPARRGLSVFMAGRRTSPATADAETSQSETPATKDTGGKRFGTLGGRLSLRRRPEAASSESAEIVSAKTEEAPAKTQEKQPSRLMGRLGSFGRRTPPAEEMPDKPSDASKEDEKRATGAQPSPLTSRLGQLGRAPSPEAEAKSDQGESPFRRRFGAELGGGRSTETASSLRSPTSEAEADAKDEEQSPDPLSRLAPSPDSSPARPSFLRPRAAEVEKAETKDEETDKVETAFGRRPFSSGTEIARPSFGRPQPALEKTEDDEEEDKAADAATQPAPEKTVVEKDKEEEKGEALFGRRAFRSPSDSAARPSFGRPQPPAPSAADDDEEKAPSRFGERTFGSPATPARPAFLAPQPSATDEKDEAEDNGADALFSNRTFDSPATPARPAFLTPQPSATEEEDEAEDDAADTLFSRRTSGSPAISARPAFLRPQSVADQTEDEEEEDKLFASPRSEVTPTEDKASEPLSTERPARPSGLFGQVRSPDVDQEVARPPVPLSKPQTEQKDTADEAPSGDKPSLAAASLVGAAAASVLSRTARPAFGKPAQDEHESEADKDRLREVIRNRGRLDETPPPAPTETTAAEKPLAPKAPPAAAPAAEHKPMPIAAPPEPKIVSSVPRVEWKLPDYMALLEPGSDQDIDQYFLLEQARIIEDTLASFGAPGKVVEVNSGPVITQFGVEPDYLEKRGGRTRVKVSAIAALDKDLALALAARTIRVEAPVPGKGFVGIEVPNAEAALVSLRDVMSSEEHQKMVKKSPLTIGLGQSVDGSAISADLTTMPHLLIAGTTGSGKSVCVNAIICCLLLQNTPDDLQIIMVDPKRVELTGYNGIPHLISNVVVDLERIIGVLKWVQREMDERYRKLGERNARNIQDYNRKLPEGGQKMPYLIVVVDELADLMMLAPEETEKLLARLAQMARATGIHLIISTQRPSVDVVTGLIKANFPARIAFAVASSVDSRVILDTPGAERLLGRGDMLYQAPDASVPVRMQGVFVSDPEIDRITRYWKEQAIAVKRGGAVGAFPKPHEPESSSFQLPTARSERFEPEPPPPPTSQKSFWAEVDALAAEAKPADGGEAGEDDDLYEEAVQVVKSLNKASISLLQRRLRIGYTRAARLIDLMEQRGVISQADGGSKPRRVVGGIEDEE